MPKYVLTTNFYKVDKKQATFFKLITTKSKHSYSKGQ